MSKKKICIVGGAGHIGFPLGLVLAKKNSVYLYDINKNNCEIINKGKSPFFEESSENYIKKYKKNYLAGQDTNFIKNSDIIIITLSTPVKKNKPDLKNFFTTINYIKKFINKNQLIIIRSSVFPGSIKKISYILRNNNCNIAYCPERILQGKSLIELEQLPQIVSGVNERSISLAVNFFKNITKKIIICSILEAELIKLLTNTLRYINFAIANQFYNICLDNNVDFNKIRNHMIFDYPRNHNIQKAGFAAGPCLTKDTMQLVNFSKKKLSLGKESIKINENFPNLISKVIKKINIKNKRIGVLGLAFKANVDDIRNSLSFPLIKKIKKFSKKIYISDEFYKNKKIISKELLVKKCNIIIIAVPHDQYKNIRIPKNKILIDTWNIVKK